MIYDAFGDRQAARFRMFAAAVAGERALAAAAGLPPGAMRQLSRATSFRESLMRDASDELLALHEQFPVKSELLEKHPVGRYTGFYLELSRISGEVMRSTIRQATFGLENPLGALETKRIGAGAIGELVQRRLADPTFKVRDTAGRQWNAETLVRLLARDYAYQTYIDHQFDKAVNAGVTAVKLTHPDPTHIFAGAEFKLDSTWLERREAIFHINSSLTVDHASLPA